MRGRYIKSKGNNAPYRIYNLPRETAGEPGAAFIGSLSNIQRKASTTRRRLSSANIKAKTARSKVSANIAATIPLIEKEVDTYSDLFTRYDKQLKKHPNPIARVNSVEFEIAILPLIDRINTDLRMVANRRNMQGGRLTATQIKNQLEQNTLPVLIRLREEITKLQDYYGGLSTATRGH